MNTIAIQQYEAQGGELLAHANSLTITDAPTREKAATFTTQARGVIKTIEEEFRPDIDKAHQLHRDLLARMNKLIAPFKEARQIVDQEIKRDYLQRERERQIEERNAQAAADRQRRVQEEALRKEAEEAIDAGDLETAEALLDSEVAVSSGPPTPIVDKTTRTVKGSVTARKDIKVELVDKAAVIAAVAAGELPDVLLDVNMGAAKRYVKALGRGTGIRMPGFKLIEDAVVSGRGMR